MKERLVIVARDASGRIISRVQVSLKQGNESLQEVVPLARNMLRIKDCCRTEIHPFESDVSTYTGAPLLALQTDDLFWGNATPSATR